VLGFHMRRNKNQNEKNTDRVVKSGIDAYGNYWRNRMMKTESQAVPAQSRLFNDCVFFILGFVGRGKESRLSLTKLIEKNGGRTVIGICSQVTHVITDHICKSRRNQLDAAIEKGRIAVVKPEFVLKCVEEQRIVDATPYLSSRPSSRTIDSMFKPIKK
jgi:hypothetical protein